MHAEATARLLATLLEERGHDADARDLAPLLGDGGPRRAAGVLAGRGIAARVVAAEPGRLDLPTLAWRDEGPVLVRDRRALPGATAALDLSPALPRSGTIAERLLALASARRGALVRVLSTTVLVQLCALVPPLVAAAAVDRALPDGARELLGVLAVAIAGGALARGWVGLLRERALAYLDGHLRVGTQRGAVEHLLALPLDAVQGRSTAELAQAAFAAESVAGLPAALLPALLDGALALGALALLGAHVPGAALLVLGGALVMTGAALLAGRRQARQGARELDLAAAQSAALLELLESIVTLKAAAAARRVAARWLRRLRGERAAGLSRQRTGLVLDVALEALRQGLVTTLLIWAGARALGGALGVGEVLLAVQLGQVFLGSAFALVEGCLRLTASGAERARLRDALAIAPAPARRTPARPPVVLEDVWFRYGPEQPWILRGVDLRVAPGAQHRLTGPSGCGKTTVLRLAAGLLRPERGLVSVGGRDPATVRVAYLPQGTHLYGGPLRETLRILSGDAPEARLLEAARRTGLDELVRALPMGWDTPLPPGGGTLSGGQRQLVALTAIAASEAEVVLLDEAMANLDRVTQARLAKAELFAGRTVISVEHDG